jgi:8-oxo-dGTP pyrophosphatase MutT (NUDIX family)
VSTPQTPQPARPHQADLHVAGVDASGERVIVFRLAHGIDPVRALRGLGWVSEGVRDIDTVTDRGHELTLVYAVRPAVAGDAPAAEVAVPTDPGLVRAPGEDVHPYQRAAAYGLVRSDRGVLLTQLSETTNAAGRWTLPGGGIDAGESPLQALHREVWEESGQDIEDAEVLDIHTQHWIGRAPSGRLEDFHAVRIVFTAICPRPTDPVVYDVGGSTAAVRWVDPAELGRYRITRSFAPHLEAWLRP